MEGNDNYDSLTVSISDLNDRLDFLQDNVEGLNLQFRRLNTLFLDTQVALAEYKAAVDEGAFGHRRVRDDYRKQIDRS